jgi:hypothetical protein
MKKLLVALTIAGLFSALAPLTLANLGSDAPKGLAFDSSGNLFVARNTTGTIVKFTPDGHRSTFASGLRTPQVLVFDTVGNLYVSDSISLSPENTTILKFAPDGTKSTFATGTCTVGMAFDKEGNLFVSDLFTRSILKFAPDGSRTTFVVEVTETSPDEKWEYIGGEEPKIVKNGTKEVALDLSDECSGGVDWSPDSKRFALNCRDGGRYNGGASFYELQGDKWKTLKSPNEDAQEILDKAIAVQVKKRGLPKDTDLRLIWETLRVDRWVDSNTAIVYGGLEGAVRKNLDKAFGAHFLVTLKFDAQGNWKIVKSHKMSEKEIAKKP